MTHPNPICVGATVETGGEVNVPLRGEVIGIRGSGWFREALVRFSPAGPRFDTWYLVGSLRRLPRLY